MRLDSGPAVVENVFGFCDSDDKVGRLRRGLGPFDAGFFDGVLYTLGCPVARRVGEDLRSLE